MLRTSYVIIIFKYLRGMNYFLCLIIVKFTFNLYFVLNNLWLLLLTYEVQKLDINNNLKKIEVIVHKQKC